jgi:ArsR family transcriptional regulator
LHEWLQEADMKNPDYEALSARLRLLAHPERLRILDAVRRDAECVCHLEALLDKPQPYVSQQLRLLREAGLVCAEQQGQNIYYRLADGEVREWLDAILGFFEGELPGMAAHKQVIACACPKCSNESSPVRQPVALEA